MNPTRRDALKIIAAGLLSPALPVAKPVVPTIRITGQQWGKTNDITLVLRGIPNKRIRLSGAGPTLRADYVD